MVYTDAYTFYRLEHELAHYLRVKSPHWEETELEGAGPGVEDLRCFNHLTGNLHRHPLFQPHHQGGSLTEGAGPRPPDA